MSNPQRKRLLIWSSKIFRNRTVRYIPLYILLLSMDEKPTRLSVFKQIGNNLYCDDKCPYSEFCPRMLDSVMSKSQECLVRLNYEKEFDRFYNLYFADTDGMKNEMRATAYAIASSCDTKEELMSYFNSITKMLSTFYSPEKSNKDSAITDVKIIFENVKGGK